MQPVRSTMVSCFFSIGHPGAEAEKGLPKAAGIPLFDEFGGGMALEFVHFSQEPTADLFWLHELFEFVEDVLDFTEFGGVNRADRFAGFPVDDGAVRGV